MPSPLSNLGLRQPASSSRMQTPADTAEIESAIMLGHVETVRARLGEEGISREAWRGLRAHVSDSGSGSAVKESLQQALADAALKYAVRKNDIDTARQALLRGADPEGIAAHSGADDMRALLTYARRKNKLYPPNGLHGPETDLDRALRNGLKEDDREKAEDILCLWQATNGKNTQEAWRDAIKGKRVDIQRAILLLGWADRDRNFRLLQEDAVTDPGVAAVMKEIPYFSPKRGLPNNFNSKATFRGINEEIVCSDLVEHRQAKLEQSDRRKFDYVQYDSVQNIAANVSYDNRAKHDHLIAHAAETHLFHNHDFGKVLFRQFGEMQRKKETTRLLLLASTDHAMSVELKIKDKDGKPHYVAALFDPNATTSHIRFASDDMRTLDGLTLKGFIKSEVTYKSYYQNSDEISTMFVRPAAPAQPQAESASANRGAGAVKNRTLTSCIEGEQLSGTALYYMLAHGFSGDIRRLKNEIAKQIAKRPEEERIQSPVAERADGVLGLFMALQNGYADTIEAFGKVLVELQVPPDKCAELLAAKRTDGVPGLFMALQKGHADAIKAFGKVLVELQMPPDKCAELLAAKRTDGVSGLQMALKNEQLEAVEQYIKIVKAIAPELGDEQRAALLKEIKKSHAKQMFKKWWVNSKDFDELTKKNPGFDQRFKEMEDALKKRTR